MENRGSQRVLFKSIRARLIISFSLLVLVILAVTTFLDIKGIPFTPFLGDQGELKAEAVRRLNLIADIKKERLMRWIEERRDDAKQWDLLRKKKSYKNLLNYLNTVRTSYGVIAI